MPLNLPKMQPALERQLGLLGFELVLAEQAKEGRDTVLRLYIDHLDAETSKRKVTLDDCVAANEGLVAWLDVEFPDLREQVGLEISSPGMERPLVKAAHFRRFAGRLCRVQTRLPLQGQKRFKGWIGPCSGTELTLEEDGVLKTIPLDEIQKARLAPFDEAKTPPAKHVKAVLTGPPDADLEIGPIETGGVETSPAVED
jgi:ribosome maturation factor RimP